MNLARTREIKIFLTFLIVYALFSHWVGWNEESRTALAKSISREGKLYIDSYANLTGDRFFYNNHYYSDKAPGTSFLAAPIYKIFDSITTTKENISQILAVFLLSAVPGALLVVLIYKTSGVFIKNSFYRILLSFSFGLGTPIFPYSTVLMGTVLASFFGFLGFYIILKIFEKNLDKKYFLIAGILFGFSFVVEYLMILIILGILLYLHLSKISRKSILYCLIGVVLGTLPLIIYNSYIFSTPLQLSVFHAEAATFPISERLPYQSTPYISKLTIDEVLIRFLASFFLPYRGVFFYAPILILSIFGFYYLYKENKCLAAPLFIILFLFSIFIGLYTNWTGGSSFGLRYISPFIPFLSIPMFVFFKKHGMRSLLKFVFIILLIISVSQNFIGFSAPWEGPIYIPNDDYTKVKAIFTWGSDVFEQMLSPDDNIMLQESMIFFNPLYDYYLPNFMVDGPRGRVLEGLFYDPLKTDIRDSNPMPIREIKLFSFNPFGILVLKIPFLIIPILLLVTTLIWKKELSKIFVFKKMTLLSVLVVLIVLLFASRFEFKNLVYVFKIGNPEQSWYEQLETEDLRWMQQNARISLFNSNKSQERRLFFYIRSFNKDRNFTVFINGNLIDKFVALKEGGFVHTSIFNLLQGENLIEFYSEEDCDIPHFVIDSGDDRCLSIGIKDLSLKSVEKDEFIFGLNWYEGEEKWMKNDGTVLLYNSDDNNRKIKLYIDTQGYINDWPISMFLNDGLADRFTVFKESSKIHTSMITLEPGENILRFHSDEGCKITNENVNSSDKRCLSIIIKSITVVTMNELISENKMLNFGYNWYDSEEIDSVRWMNQDGTIHLINFDNNSKEVKLYSYLKSYYEDRKINIYLNNQLIDSLIAFKEGSEVYTPMITLEPGENILRFHSDEGCVVVSEIGKSNDNRCISIGIKNVSLLSQNEIKERAFDYIFNKNWYDKTPNENERWMNNNATISLFYFDSPYESVIFNFDFFPYFKERTVSFYLNEELKNVFEIDKDGGWVYTAPLSLKSGENVLRFYSEEGCTVIDDVEKNGDYRCVSLNMRNITLS